jgi:hypothetical protein
MQKRTVRILTAASLTALVAVAAYYYYSRSRTESLASACDQLAASPYDSQKPASVKGVAFEAINSEQAIPACHAAVADQPKNARLQYQYGRALEAGKQAARAMSAYAEAHALGWPLAAHNMGNLYRIGGAGVEKDGPAALKWFAVAASEGIDEAKRMAAYMLEEGEGIATPDLTRAAAYWRSLADSGDAEASERIALLIRDRRVSPTTSDEMEKRLISAADKGRFVASYEYAKNVLESPQSAAKLSVGAKYALQAYRAAVAAPINSVDGWLPNQLLAFRTYKRFIDAGARNEMASEEYLRATVDFPDTDSGGISVPIECGGKKEKIDIFVWQWSRAYPQTDTQAEWIKQTRGCGFPQEILESMRRLFSISVENKQPFPDLVKYALSSADSSASKPSSAQSTAQSEPSVSPTPARKP